MQLHHRRVRYKDLNPCRNAFVDTRTPGSDQKENFTIIGPGVSENPEQHTHIELPHGFNIGGARQPPGCLNSQHSHLTEEVFFVHSSRWAFMTGVDGSDGRVELDVGDVISIPTQVFRGFENIGNQLGFLFAVLGGDDPGRVLWAPQVFELAEQYGLALLENGSLVDLHRNQQIPDGTQQMPVTTAEQVDTLRRIDDAGLEKVVLRTRNFNWNNDSMLVAHSDAQEAQLIGPSSPVERLAASKLDWQHNFCVRALRLAPGGEIGAHRRHEAEVITMLAGEITLVVDGMPLLLQKGDTFTTPIGSTRIFMNQGPIAAVAYITRGSDTPAPPTFT